MVFNRYVLGGILALMMMNVGGNIAFGKITESLANLQGPRAVVNLDQLTFYSSVFDVVSGLFGGGGGEAIISGTATSSHPVAAAALMSFGMAVILLLGWLPKIGKFVPKESIAGFLLMLGVVLTFMPNSQLAVGLAPTTNVGQWLSTGGFLTAFGAGVTPMHWVAIVTAIVTAVTFNPFTGMLAGLAIRALILGNILEFGVLFGIFLAAVYFFNDAGLRARKFAGKFRAKFADEPLDQ
jgi:AGZA family xanthine/uracil permease-like MFS transporter